MKKKGVRSRTTTPVGTRARRLSAAAAEFLETPLPMAFSPSQSPESAIFGNSTKRRKKAMAAADSPASPLPLFASPSPSRPPAKNLGSIDDLKDMASSRLDDLKCHIDRSHSVVLNELDLSYSRLHKRFKIQNQECQKVSDEAEKGYKKMSGLISQSQEAMMTSYAEFMADAHASTSHACRTSLTKLSQSFEKAIDAL